MNVSISFASPLQGLFLAMIGSLGIALPGHAEEHDQETKTESSDLRRLHAADYGQWERLGGETLSRDGRWLLYTVMRVDEKKTLHLVDLEIEDRKESVVASIEQGERATFSKDSEWLSFFVGKSPDDKKESSGNARPPGQRRPGSGPGPRGGAGRAQGGSSSGQLLKLRRLSDGETTEIDHVNAIRFSADSRYATIEVVASGDDKKENAKALIVRDLEAGSDTTFGNVVRHSWSDEKALLAMVIDSPSISNTLQLFDPHSGRLRTLDSSEEEYASVLWRKDAMDLVAMREKPHKEKEDVSHVLLAWRELDGENSVAFQYDHVAHESFPEDLYVSSGGLNWSESGKAIYLNLKAWENKPEEKSDEDEDAKDKDKDKEAKGKAEGEKAEGEKKSTDARDKEGAPVKKAESDERETAEVKREAQPRKRPTPPEGRPGRGERPGPNARPGNARRRGPGAGAPNQRRGRPGGENREGNRERPKPDRDEQGDGGEEADPESDAEEEPSEESKEKSPGKPKKPAKSLRETIEEDSNVEVWHSKDVDIMPRQKKQASGKKNPNRRAVWWLDEGSLVQLGNELTESINVIRAEQHVIGRDATPHERHAMFGPRLSDTYVIDAKTGERERVLEAVQYQLGASPDGGFILYIDNGHVWSYEVDGGAKRNLTEGIDSHFTNQENDSLAKEKPPYAGPQWFKDGSAVLLYDRFDIWAFAPDGSSHQRLTEGAEEHIRHRVASATFLEDDERLLDPSRPVMLSTYGDRTKKSGFARMSLSSGDGTVKRKELETLIWEDKAVGSLRRAEENKRRWIFERESADDSPDLFVAGPDLAEARQISKTNPFQEKFYWGGSELVNYVNDNGVPLQGALRYPANYEEGRQYPMIVLIYEKLSQNLHRYAVPSERSPYNASVFSAEGYFVFNPDIVYRPQEPGVSAVECIVPAVKAVLAKGMVDPVKVALMGHSWGGYQTAFTVTQTNIFAAGVAGAPLTDMMSMSVQVYWNSGGTNARIFHQSQGRMDTPFWRDVNNFVRNSPIHGMDKLNTPLLMTFGDKDGAVDFGQGVEMYNAARLAGKEDFVMLVYPGENHGLRQKENQVDYHYRILEWLGHYLKGETAPTWIIEGMSHLDRQKELEDKKEKKESDKKTKRPPGPNAMKKRPSGGADKKPEGETKEPEEGEKKKPEGEKEKPKSEKKKPESEKKKPESEKKKPESEKKKPEGETKKKPEGEKDAQAERERTRKKRQEARKKRRAAKKERNDR